MQFYFHLKELKFRSFYLSLSFLFSWILLFSHKFYLFSLFTCHLQNSSQTSHFIFTYLSEALSSFLLFTAFLSFLYILPIFLYHIYQFLNPGLYLYESIKIKYSFIFFLFILYGSLLFNWIFLLPYFTKLLLYDNIDSLMGFYPKISEYISFLIVFSFSIFLFLFIPILLLLIIPFLSDSRDRLNNNNIIFRYRLHIYFIISLGISIITPPDLLLVSLFISLFILFLEFLFFLYCIGGRK
jgi:sec-independent protein translocase protein TatC